MSEAAVANRPGPAAWVGLAVPGLGHVLTGRRWMGQPARVEDVGQHRLNRRPEDVEGDHLPYFTTILVYTGSESW